MIPPGRKQIMQLVLGSPCDIRDCSNCTQLLPFQKKWTMSLDNVRKALRSVRDYPGIIGAFGGNPCLHPEFEEVCRIFREERPDQRKTGIWTNNLVGKGRAVRETFYPHGYFNLNVHESSKAADEMRRELPGKLIHGENRKSRHSSIMTALKDYVADPAERQAMIERCDIGLNWSGSIVQNSAGELRGYFCEVAGAFDLARGEDHGVPIVDGWWRQPMAHFAHQVEICHSCGIPLSDAGHMDMDFTYDVSKTNMPLVQLSVGKRVKILERETIPTDHIQRPTDYQRLETK